MWSQSHVREGRKNGSIIVKYVTFEGIWEWATSLEPGNIDLFLTQRLPLTINVKHFSRSTAMYSEEDDCWEGGNCSGQSWILQSTVPAARSVSSLSQHRLWIYSELSLLRQPCKPRQILVEKKLKASNIVSLSSSPQHPASIM